MTAAEAREAILAGETVKMEIGDEPGEHTLLIYLEDGSAMSSCIAGWAGGTIEPVCAADSDFLLKTLSGRQSLEVVDAAEYSNWIRPYEY